MALEPGWAYLAPGGRQMKVIQRGQRRVIRITDDPPENGFRPSANYLFRSAAEVFGGNVIAAVLTGMGRDGADGCRELKNRGAFVIAQHADGCVVYGMPKVIAEEQLADRIVPLERIAGALIHRVRPD
jgi:two-component system chemotaxis response regulator CheB